MAQRSITLSANKWAQVDQNYPSIVTPMGSTYGYAERRQSNGTVMSEVFVGFSAFSSSLRNNRLYSVTAKWAIQSSDDNAKSTGGTYSAWQPARVFLCPCESNFDASSLMWSNKPGQLGNKTMISTRLTNLGAKRDVDLSLNADSATAEDQSLLAKNFLVNHTGYFYCAITGSDTRSGTVKTYVHRTLENGSTVPYLTIVYDDSVMVQSKITPGNCPTGGYVNPRTAREFSWTFEKNDTYYCVGGFTQQSAKLCWRVSGESTWNEVSASGSTQNLTVPANTFPVNSTIEWYLQGTDTAGTTSTSATYTFSTVAAPVVISLIDPINSVEDGSKEISFEWTYSTADGFTPTGVSLLWKQVGSETWHVLLTNAAWRTSYTVAANTFPAGEIQWAVRGFNIDGAEGNYAMATFVSVAAPEVSMLEATAVPYSTITWQAEGQQAFAVEAAGKTYGPYFGTEKSFTLPDYLEDGTHAIRLRVLGTYGIWSEWNETSVTVENVPGEEIILSGTASTDAELVWTTEETTEDFYICRDGKIIGHTAENYFTDRFTSGNHNYEVINKLENGNYTKSNLVSLEVNPENTVIALVAGGEWLEIKHFLKDQTDPEYEESVDVTYDHIGGRAFPSVVISEYRDMTASYSAVFLCSEEEQHQRFRAMLGRPVVIKTKDGEVQIGVLESWSRRPRRKDYTEYAFTVRRIDWEDYVDDTH